jgi:hypothetical protein
MPWNPDYYKTGLARAQRDAAQYNLKLKKKKAAGSAKPQASSSKPQAPSALKKTQSNGIK